VGISLIYSCASLIRRRGIWLFSIAQSATLTALCWCGGHVTTSPGWYGLVSLHWQPLFALRDQHDTPLPLSKQNRVSLKTKHGPLREQIFNGRPGGRPGHGEPREGACPNIPALPSRFSRRDSLPGTVCSILRGLFTVTRVPKRQFTVTSVPKIYSRLPESLKLYSRLPEPLKGYSSLPESLNGY